MKLCKVGWKPYAAALYAQLQKASLFVQLNIAERYSNGNSPSFTRHLAIAYGSAVETGELLEIALDAEVGPAKVLGPLLTRNQRSQRPLLGLLKSRRKN